MNAKKMVSSCVLGCWCRSLLRLGFRVCSYDFLLLAGYACMRKNGFLLCSGLLVSIFASFRILGLFIRFAFAYWLCMYAKKWFLTVVWVDGFHLSPANVLLLP